MFSHFERDDWLIIQNEVNNLALIIDTASEKHMRICFNPAPFDPSVLSLPLDKVGLFVVNEVEAEGLSGEHDPQRAMDVLANRFPDTDILITLGSDGVRYGKGPTLRMSFGTWDVPVADTTAAGDTFIGCYIASIATGLPIEEALRRASAASSVTVMRDGAMDSIPTPDEFSLLDGYRLIEPKPTQS